VDAEAKVRAEEREALKTEFYSQFDRSKAELWLELSDQEMEGKGRLLGTGSHFRAWAVGGVVFKRALPDTFGKKGALNLRGWQEALAKAPGVGELMPPFELLVLGEQVGMVMPFGSEPMAMAGKAWFPLADRTLEFERALTQAGLVLDDVPQIRCRAGVPFLVDLSDLKLTQP
jgi:hypothetical protein